MTGQFQADKLDNHHPIFPRGVPIAKRLFDLVFAGLALVILSPILGIIALFIWAKLGRPILFRQTRPGYHGCLFDIYKFRSMSEAKSEEGAFLPDEVRLTKLGRFLRSTSLDELPSLYNVLRGEMSLVGPRPLLVKYLERYSAEQARRHDVLPGITGWAQVNGRNTATWEDKFRMDVWYVEHWSVWLDVKIIAMTVLKVLKREGINQPGEATAQEFRGSDGN